MLNILGPIAAELIKDHFKDQRTRPIKSQPDESNLEKTKLDIANEMIEKATDTRPFWKRKTFWAMVISVVVPILNKALGWNMDITEVTAAISPLLLFIATEQWKKK